MFFVIDRKVQSPTFYNSFTISKSQFLYQSYLFLARICFPKTESIPSIIRRRYGDKVLREVRQFEKSDYKLGKVQLDFLCKCMDSDVLPKFLNFNLANKKLYNSLTSKNCQRNLLITEINLSKEVMPQGLKKGILSSPQ